MFVHTVHFWLRPNLSASEREAFVEGLRSLATSPNVASCRVGRPAGTPRAVVDNSWDYQLLMRFDTPAAHDAYQAPGDAAHTAFIERFKSCWTRVLVFDSLDA